MKHADDRGVTMDPDDDGSTHPVTHTQTTALGLATAPKAALDVQHLCKGFRRVIVLDGVSCSVHAGEIVGLLGPNGAGKTTLQRILVDILRPDSGRVRILGSDSVREVRDEIGYLPEERGLYPKSRVIEVLTYFAALKGTPPHLARAHAQTMLVSLGLPDAMLRRTSELSKGMQQKVQLVGSLVHRPKLLLLDEPFSGLDPVSVNQVKALIRQVRDEGAAVMVSTHLMNQAEDLCNRVLFLNGGRLLESGSPQEIARRYADDTLLIETDYDLKTHPAVERVVGHDHRYRVWLRSGVTPRELLESLLRSGAEVEHFSLARPSLEEVFLRVAGGAPNEMMPPGDRP